MTSALTYVYCLVRSPRRPSLRDVPQGMAAGAAVRLLEAGDAAWLVVSSVPVREYGEAALERGLQNIDWVGRRAMSHEAVVEHFLGAPALLPMQLFSLFTSDERALAHVARDRRRIQRILSRIERQHEWGVRLTLHEGEREKGEREKKKRGKGGGGRDREKDDSGAAYLTRKRDLLHVQRERLVAARAEANRIYRAMAREATAARRRLATEQAAPGNRLLLDAAFLVPVSRAAAFRAALRRHARKLGGSGVAISLTGPWPPYNFI